MPSLSLDDLKKSVAPDQNPYNVVKPSHQNNQEGLMSRGGRRDRRTVPETKRLIKEFIHERGKPTLILDICDRLDRKPSPHFRGILAEMVRAGELHVDVDNAPGSPLPRYWYSLTW